MYLSRVHLDWKDARNPYDWHRALWRLFPDRAQEKRGFLFRVEQQVPGRGASILLQSPEAPKLDEPLVRVVATPKKIDLSAVVNETVLRFRLTANVVKTIRDVDDPARAIRVPLVKEQQQLDWLNRKLDGAVRIEIATVTANRPVFFNRRGQAGKLVTATFDGTLVVMNSDVLETLCCSGIGPGKSFGCGLLSLARCR
jgi:CRISPR system Cascade subunit CasE